MCGLVAIYHYANPSTAVDEAELAAISLAMTHRGPDGNGQWLSENCRIGLAHRRLSVIDLSEAASQPMVHGNDDLVLVFNGEIYNYRELRAELIGEGVTFNSHSDTEVLLHLYNKMGEGMVSRLQGMYAFAIWDQQAETLFMARDPYGIKPLYYADDGNTLRVASQVKALLAGGAIPPDADDTAIAAFFTTGSVPEPMTINRSVKALPAGCSMTASADGLVTRPFCNIKELFFQPPQRQPQSLEPLQQLRQALTSSIKKHLEADVPIALFLSAGIDSCVLLAMVREVAPALEVQAITLAFEEYRGSSNDEAPLAAQVAKAYGCRHNVRYVSEAEFRADLPDIFRAMDQPTIDGINTWFVCKAARELGYKVALSGLGGDELFAGYPSFKDIPRWNKWFRWPAKIPGVGRGFQTLAQQLAGKCINPKIPGLITYGSSLPGAWLLRRAVYMPWESSLMPGGKTLGEYFDALNWVKATLQSPLSTAKSDPSPRAKISVLESASYMRNQLLRDADWAGMAQSVEVRLPLVDTELLTTLAPLLATERLNIDKKWLARCPGSPLPVDVTCRAKTGFTTPIKGWLTAMDERQANAQRHQHWSRAWSKQVASAFGLGPG